MGKGSFINLNKKLDRLMGILTPIGVCTGLFLGPRVSWLKPLVTYLFAFVTFSGALGMKFSDFLYIKKKPSTAIIAIASSHIVMPTIVYIIASLFFGDNPDTITGFILLYANPTAVVSYIWSSIYRGNDILSLSLILISTLLAPIVTPYTTRLFTHSTVDIDTTGMMLSLLYMVVIPCLLGVLVNTLSKEKAKTEINPYLKPFTKLALLLVSIINTSQISGKLSLEISLLQIAVLNVFFAFMGFFLGFTIAKIMRFTREDIVSVSYTVGLRNISAALVLAVNFFPAETSIPVLIGITIQQVIAAIFGSAFIARKLPILE